MMEPYSKPSVPLPFDFENDGPGSPSTAREKISPSKTRTSLFKIRKSPSKSSLPELYELALCRNWSRLLSRATSHPREAEFIHPSDGTTALHVAVISRVVVQADMSVPGIGFNRKSVDEIWRSSGSNVPAPLEVIRKLLLAFPDAVTVKCRLNGYTPLAYACLVPHPTGESDRNIAISQDSCDADDKKTKGSGRQTKKKPSSSEQLNGPAGEYQRQTMTLIDAEELVTLLLQHRKDCASILTRTGLSALDIHVVSFSQNRGHIKDAEGAGRTTTGLLRALLECDAKLARRRPMKDEGTTAVVGPLELLYRYNAPAFLSFLEREEEYAQKKAAQENGHDLHASALKKKKEWYDPYAPVPAKSETLSSTLSSWWVWKWTILLLKYGILHQKRLGARFQAVHAAASITGCPLPLMMLTVRTFPRQIREADEMKDDGNMPLHIVAAWHSADPVTANRKGMVLSALLTEYPDAARIQNHKGKTPLVLALTSGSSWDSGIRRLVKAYPEAVGKRDEKSKLFPFMMAAMYGSREALDGNTSIQALLRADLSDMRTIYGLLRSDPSVIQRSFEVEENENWANFEMNFDFDSSVSSFGDSNRGGW